MGDLEQKGVIMLIGDLLQFYTRNAPVTLAQEFTSKYTMFAHARNVPEKLRRKEVRQFDGQSMHSDYGITIWYRP